jgi:hypothetical protein
MAGKADQTLVVTDTSTVNEGRNDSGAESDTSTTSSMTLDVIKITYNSP